MSRTPQRIDALDKGLQVLSCFTRARPEWGVSELSADLHMHKSRVHRILQTLTINGFVVQDKTSLRYRLGWRMQALGADADEDARIKAAARPFLTGLQVHTKGAIHIRVIRGDANVVIDAIESPLPLRVVRPIGESNPVYFGASGKALLAFGPPALRDAVLQGTLRKFTERSITDRAAYLAELERVRRAGYAYTDEEGFVGVRSVAAPILDSRGFAIAAVTSTLPSAALPEKDIPLHGRQTAKYARLASRALSESSASPQGTPNDH